MGQIQFGNPVQHEHDAEDFLENHQQALLDEALLQQLRFHLRKSIALERGQNAKVTNDGLNYGSHIWELVENI